MTPALIMLVIPGLPSYNGVEVYYFKGVIGLPIVISFRDRVIYTYRHSGSVVERPLCDREVAGSIPGRVIPKTLKMVLAALSLGAQH